MQRITLARKIASRIVDDRVDKLFPSWAVKGCPYPERVISNFGSGKDVFDGFAEAELNDVLAFSIYCKQNWLAPEEWDPVTESAEDVELNVIEKNADKEKYAAKYMADMVAPPSFAKKYVEVCGKVYFDEKSGKAKFRR